MAALALGRLLNNCRVFPRICRHNALLQSVKSQQECVTTRGLKNSRKLAPYLRELYKRRIEAGPEPEQHPSETPCWNYNSEIYSFGKRFGEDFDEEILRRAFISSAYVEAEEENRRKLGIEESVPLTMKDNTELAEKGQHIVSQYIKAYLRHSYPMMLEEGIQAVTDYMLSDEMMFHIATNLGLTDLIMSPVYPPEPQMYISSFKAVIGALAESQNTERAGLFVRDFIICHLCGKNLMDIWDVKNPMGLLSSILATQGRGPPEPRLLWQSGKSTLLSLYHVGIYCDKQLIGKSPGETVSIAEEMAARDALTNLMNIPVNTKSLQFGQESESWKLDLNRKNQSANDLLSSVTSS